MENVAFNAIAQSVIAATGTSTKLYALLATAAGGGSYTEATEKAFYSSKMNAFYLAPLDGDIYVAQGADPTSSTGILVRMGERFPFQGGDIADVRIIRAGSNNVSVNFIPVKLAGGEILAPIASPFILEKLSALLDKVATRPEGGSSQNITASTLVRTGAGILIGFYVNSTGGGTVLPYDNTAASGTKICNTITPAIGWHSLGPVRFTTGLYIAISGTIDITPVYADVTAE